MIGRDRIFNNNLPNMAGWFRYGSSLTEGTDTSRTSSGSYSEFYTTLDFFYPVFIDKILWDIFAAGTYTFYIDGVSVGSKVISGTTADAEIPVNKIVGGNAVVFKYTVSAPVRIADSGGVTYTGTYFSMPKLSYYDGGNFLYCASFKLVYRPVVLVKK